MKVTNLDTVTHKVELVVSGSTLTRSIAPDETTYFSGDSDGQLSLITAPAASEAKAGEVASQGMLANVIGVRRNKNIPATMRDDYVIWPGGELVLQRRKLYMGRR
jgi:hypothetical protein